MAVIKRLMGVPVRFGGEVHSGWLPANAATPPPTPVEDALVDFEINAVRAPTSSNGTRATPATTEIRGTKPSKVPWNRRVPNSASGLKNGIL
jgi:hypothetical protein